MIQKNLKTFWKNAKKASILVGSNAVPMFNTLERGSKYKQKTKRNRRPRKKRGKAKNTLQNISQHADLALSPGPVIDLSRGRKLPKALAKYQLGWTYQHVQAGGQGMQNIDYLFMFGSREGLLGTTSTNRNDRIRLARSLFDLNPYEAIPAGTVFPAAIASPLNDSYLLEWVKGHHTIVNLTNIACDVTVYWLVCKNGNAVDPLSAWDHSLTASTLGQVAEVNATATATVSATVGQPVKEDVGQVPQHWKSFNTLWRTAYTTKFTLQGGDQRRMPFKIKYNKVVTKDALNDLPNFYLANLTCVPMVVVNGALVGLVDAQTPTPSILVTEVGYGSSKIGNFLESTISCRAIANSSRIPTVSHFNGQLVNSGINPAFVNDIDGITSKVTA